MTEQWWKMLFQETDFNCNLVEEWKFNQAGGQVGGWLGQAPASGQAHWEGPGLSWNHLLLFHGE